MIELKEFIQSIKEEHEFDSEKASSILRNLENQPSLGEEEVLMMIRKLDTSRLTQSTFMLLPDNASSFQNFFFSILFMAMTKDENILDVIFKALAKEKEGSAGRHFFIIQFMAIVNSKYQAQQFSKAADCLLFVLEHVFSEVYQNDQESGSIHTAEENQLLASEGVKSLMQNAMIFLTSNKQLIEGEVETLNIWNYYRIDSSFICSPITRPPEVELNRAAFIKFYGGLMAKVEFAKFYCELQGFEPLVSVLSDMQNQLANLSIEITQYAWDIIESEIKLVSFLKYRSLCLEEEYKRPFVNFHAVIYLNEMPSTLVWPGYGANFCIYLLRNVVKDQLAVVTPLKLIQVLSSVFSLLPANFFGGIEYYFEILDSSLKKLKKSGIRLANSNFNNIFLQDFLLVLQSINHNATKAGDDLICEWVQFVLDLMDTQSRFSSLMKCIDNCGPPSLFCSSKGFALGLVRSYKRDVELAMQGEVSQRNAYLMRTPMVKLMHIAIASDPKQLASIGRSRLSSFRYFPHIGTVDQYIGKPTGREKIFLLE